MILPSSFTAQSVSLIKAEDRDFAISRGGNIQIGRRQSFETQVEVTSPPIRHENVGDFIAFLDDVGTGDAFDITLPLMSEAKGSITSNLIVKTDATAGSKVVQLSNAPASVTGLVRPNDMLNFSGHSKAYWVGVDMTGGIINTFDTDAFGDMTLRLSQPLISNVSAGETVDFLTPIITVIRNDEEVEQAISANDSNFVTVSFEAIELI